MEWQVGQKVTVVSPYNSAPDREGTITKIARKYLTVEVEGVYSGPKQFEIETGRVKHDGYSRSSRIVTPEILADERERTALWARLRKLGLEPRLGAQIQRSLPTDKLAAIVAILEES